MLGLLKRALWQWGCTLWALTLLLAGGVLICLWISEHGIPPAGEHLYTYSLTVWRYLVYGLLLMLWPGIVRYLINRRNPKIRPIVNRRSLLILITGYEALVVRKLLTVIGAWVG